MIRILSAFISRKLWRMSYYFKIMAACVLLSLIISITILYSAVAPAHHLVECENFIYLKIAIFKHRTWKLFIVNSNYVIEQSL